VFFLAVDETSGLTGVEQAYGEIRSLKMVWPDSAGRLPWLAGYNNPLQAQPLLGPRP
jgi:hypothetical protein